MDKRFTDQLWEGIAPIYQAILAHPFLTTLVDGSLPEDRFRFFIIQDAHFLRYFAKAVAAVAAIAPRDEWTRFFSEYSRDTLLVERALHDSYFRGWGLTPEEVYATPVAPSNLAYASYLQRVAHVGSFEEAVTAVLPCGWIYIRVGGELAKKGSPIALYQYWIAQYASEEYEEIIHEHINIVETAVEGLDQPRQELLRQHFTIASRYEWMFWDMAWRLQSWPI